MYCKNCGKEIDNDSKFCSYCGTKQLIIQISEIKNDLSSKPEPIIQNVNVSLSFGKPTDKVKSAEVKIDKYDRTYKGDSGATIIASILAIISFIIYLTVKFENESDQQVYLAIVVAINIVWRILATIWVVNIAKRQNRDNLEWGFFAFFLPNLALFIIGLLKKLNKPSSESQMSKSNTVLTKEEVLRGHATYDKEELSRKNINNNSEVELSDNTSDNLELGSSGHITYIRDDASGNVNAKITYNVIKIEIINPSLGPTRDEFTLEFSDGKIGKLCFSRIYKKFFFKRHNWANYFYNKKEAAINALHYYLCNNNVLNEGRYYI
jgi:hypothetical protein